MSALEDFMERVEPLLQILLGLSKNRFVKVDVKRLLMEIERAQATKELIEPEKQSR